MDGLRGWCQGGFRHSSSRVGSYRGILESTAGRTSVHIHCRRGIAGRCRRTCFEKRGKEIIHGPGYPCSPAGVTLTPELVKWESVITGEHGGYIGDEPVLYKVYLNGAFEGSTRETPMPVALPQNTALTRYTAEVEAVCGSLVSKRAASNR